MCARWCMRMCLFMHMNIRVYVQRIHVFIFHLVESSLNWSTFEQACLWQFIDAEETPIEMLVGILPLLKTSKHSEVMNHLLLQLRSERYCVLSNSPCFIFMDISGFSWLSNACLLCFVIISFFLIYK